MSEIALNAKVAMQQYKKRCKANSKKEKINNASLPAGSPMYFYCRFCGDLTDTLPESFTCTPNTTCEPCDVLHTHGLI